MPDFRGCAVSPKPFRIERLMQPDAPPTPSHDLTDAGQALQRGRWALDTVAREGVARLQRARDELAAIVANTDKAAQSVLESVEQIDDAAKTLTAALSNQHNQGLAQDIQDQVTRIYEACHFHDLVGQHASNIHAALHAIEDQITHARSMLDGDVVAASVPRPDSGLLNGPRLANDPGHASQQDIDDLFG
jgi:chemotaxis protein CheZ